MQISNTDSSRKKLAPPPILTVIMFILGVFIFLFGGLSPVFTGNIFHMFIAMGAAMICFVIGGVIMFYKQASKQKDTNGEKKRDNDSIKNLSNLDDNESNVKYVKNDKYCPYCGKKNAINLMICSECGSDL